MLFACIPELVSLINRGGEKGVAEEGVVKGPSGLWHVPRPSASFLLRRHMEVVVHFFEQNLQC